MSSQRFEHLAPSPSTPNPDALFHGMSNRGDVEEILGNIRVSMADSSSVDALDISNQASLAELYNLMKRYISAVSGDDQKRYSDLIRHCISQFDGDFNAVAAILGQIEVVKEVAHTFIGYEEPQLGIECCSGDEM